MAVIRQFEVGSQDRQQWQEESVEGEVIPLRLHGELFLQLYSLGSSSRVSKGQRSQNLRLSKDAFEQLVEIGRKHFGEK
ncbi:hypothetical protein NS334_13440 [Sphingomonas endophytica]|uniref:Uncharacterized protein n=1 Tax=Sphingomonas endophytica TaxID=869719 RepID=A0A147HYG9_9SPHN|nr:hypothetical protein NS334_13440 [Sphingomonas endophytica]